MLTLAIRRGQSGCAQPWNGTPLDVRRSEGPRTTALTVLITHHDMPPRPTDAVRKSPHHPETMSRQIALVNLIPSLQPQPETGTPNRMHAHRGAATVSL